MLPFDWAHDVACSVGFWINYGITQHIPYSRRQWLIPFAIQLVPAGMFFIGLFFLKESPRWLITKGRTEEAINNLVYLRKLPETSEYVSTEIREMQELHDRDVALVGNGFWAPFREFWTNKALLLRISITTTLFLWQNASGVNAINYYSPTIFKSLGIVGQSTSLFTTGLFGVVKTTFMAIWLLFLIDQVGRRRLLIFGSVMAAICHFFIGAYVRLMLSVIASQTNFFTFGRLQSTPHRLKCGPSCHRRALPLSSCFTSTLRRTPFLGLARHGQSDLRHSPGMLEAQLKCARRPQIGSGLSGSLASRRRCLIPWALEYTSFSRL